jgi:CSLREA domain-containing protein
MRSLPALWLAVACLPAGFSSAAFSATYTVTKTSDTFDGVCDADCSLRDAVSAANARPGSDIIVLKGTTYRLSIATPQPPDGDDSVVNDEDQNQTGDLDITDDVVIRGRQGYTAVDAGGIDRAFDIVSGISVEFRDFEIRNGHIPTRGAGISNSGSLRLTRMRLRFNAASSGFNLGQGGAVFNEGIMSIADSHFLSNEARGGEASAGEGGAIYNTARLNIRTTRFIGNVTSDDNDIGGGGAIMNRGGSVTVTRAFFQDNTTSLHGYGGAIANRSGGRLEMVNATVSGNESGEATDGGGAVANGTRQGDAGSLTMTFVTIADNDGGGLFNSGDLIYQNSIIGGNYEDFGSDQRDYHAANNCVTTVAPRSGGGSVLGLDGSNNCSGAWFEDNGAFMSVLLYPLGNNGGFAPTHALRYSRRVIDAAFDFEDRPCPTVDQRGPMRPADGDNDGTARCDVGAFERNDDD